MSDTIHSRKSPQFQEQDTFVTIGKVPEDEQISSVVDTPAGVKTPKNERTTGRL